MSNDQIMFVVGIITFFIMMLVKIPLKKCTREFASRLAVDDEEEALFYHRFNLIIILFAMIIAMILYCFILLYLGRSHFKLCYCLKAGAISMAIYEVLDQLVG